jgi:hypothetical protein
MAVHSFQCHGHHEISPENRTTVSRNDFQYEAFERLNINSVPQDLPQRRATDRNGSNMWQSPTFNGVVPVRNRSLDDDMGNVEGAFPRYARRADSAIAIDDDDDDDDDEYPPPKATISPLTILGAGRVDPFANYPVKMDITEYWLIDHGKALRELTFNSRYETKTKYVR